MGRIASLLRPGRAATFLAVAVLTVALLAVAAAAPATPVGPVLTVSPQDGFFLAPDVAVDAAGNAIVVWYGEAAGQTTAEVEIYARRYGPSGAPLGPSFRVNQSAAGQQRRPAVAVAPSGAFVVAWDTGTSTVWARRFAADGSPLSGDIPVSQSNTSRDPDVVVAPDGTFMVAWQLTAPGGDDDVAVRRFDLDGTPLGAERLPYDPAAETDFQLNPALAALPGGAAALVWEEVRATATAVVLRRLDASGAPSGATLPVADSSAEELRDPAVAAAPDGTTVVAWASYTPAGGGIAARSYSAAGEPLGAPVALAPPEAAERFLPAASVAADGSAVVAWVDTMLLQGALVGVTARRLSAAGQPEGELFYPRPPAPGETEVSGVAAAIGATAGAGLWVAWAQSPPGAGNTVSAIFMRRHVEQLYAIALPLVRR